MFGKAIISGVAVLLISACAAQMFEGKYNFNAGWRKGRIIRVATADEVFARKPWKCKPKEASSQWVVVKYLNSGNVRYVGVPLASSDPFKAGEFVYVNLVDCTLGVRTQVDSKSRV